MSKPTKRETLKKAFSAIRRDSAGEVDDVAINGDLFRLERMDSNSWWCCIYRGKRRTAFSIYRPRGKRSVVVKVIEDSIGCVDDSECAQCKRALAALKSSESEVGDESKS